MSSQNGVLGLRWLRKFCVKHEIPSGKHVFRAATGVTRKYSSTAGRRQAGSGDNAVGSRLVRTADPTAHRSGAPKMSTLNGIQQKRLNTVDLFRILAVPEWQVAARDRHRSRRRRGRAPSCYAPRANPFPASVQPPVGACDCRELDGRILSRVRRVAGLCRNERDRAQPLPALRPLR